MLPYLENKEVGLWIRMERAVCVRTVMYEVLNGSLVGFFCINLHL